MSPTSAVTTSRSTFRIMDAQNSVLVIRTEPSGYERVWEVCGSRKEATLRRTYHQHLEDQAEVRSKRPNCYSRVRNSMMAEGGAR